MSASRLFTSFGTVGLGRRAGVVGVAVLVGANLQTPQQPAGFQDVNPASTHAVSIEALYATQITLGCSQQPLRYCPQNPVTRAQMAAFLYRARHLIAAANPN